MGSVGSPSALPTFLFRARRPGRENPLNGPERFFDPWCPNMPRIARKFIENAIYLYPSTEAAKEGHAAGGTGFIIGVPLPSHQNVVTTFAIAARHTVWTHGASVVRVNAVGGGVDVFDLDPVEWEIHPDGDDVAIAAIDLCSNKHIFTYLPLSDLATRQNVASCSIGLGDEVFMVGRFVNCDGELTNVPSVRFGHLSMLPIKIEIEPGHIQESFAVEMLSKPGYSGSPVFVYEDSWNSETGIYSINSGNDHVVRLLGLNWGYITDDAEVKEKAVVAALSSCGPSVKYVPQNTGMNGVVPAWKIVDLLEVPAVKDRVSKADKAETERKRHKRGGVELASTTNAANEKRFKQTVGTLLRTPPKPHKDTK